MTLPFVDIFPEPYQKWHTRRPTPEEAIANRSMEAIKVSLHATVSTPTEAAKFIGREGPDGGLKHHMERARDASGPFKRWRRAMPSKTPEEIACYQKDYQNCNLEATSAEIDAFGKLLSEGQYLFHGGLWSSGNGMVTSRPLSTSLCPVVAFQNALWNGKAYDAGQLDLMVLRVTNPKTKAFIFRPGGTRLGHELEVLFASGATLALKNSTPVHSDFQAGKYDHPDKPIPVNVIELEIS
ncbi:TPA: hypothetical protein ACNIJL_003950 [Pseudomonas aeruginosa]